jgi:nucleoid-associated protein YgaU
MAIVFRKPAGQCLEYMRDELILLERQGVLEATEEKHPVHFHVAVLQRGRFAPATPAVATATTAPQPATPTSVSPLPSMITDSASGAIESAVDTPTVVSKAQSYSVKKGDTLSGIAKRFGLTVSRLKSLNGLRSSAIRPGQKLRVS